MFYCTLSFFRDITTNRAQKVTLKDFGLGQSVERKFLGMSKAKSFSKTVSRPMRKFPFICRL